eukprot:1184223-Prorocentrum_minimum.AAC.1
MFPPLVSRTVSTFGQSNCFDLWSVKLFPPLVSRTVSTFGQSNCFDHFDEPPLARARTQWYSIAPIEHPRTIRRDFEFSMV